ncbi:MAG: dienelactone hydrolase family protein [Pseudomonadota bacterium]|nr:dienelactone hydrolase family protein [Pseudomonadota bacterium]
MAVQTRTIDYTDGGTGLEGYFAWDDVVSGARPGVLVVHAWAGRSPFEEEVARKLAALGYAALAMDVYGKGVLGGGPEENAKLMTPFLEDRPTLQNRLKTGLQVIRDQAETDAGKVAATGYCFGGLCVLDLARTGEDFQGAVSFHGLFNKPGNTDGTAIKAKVLALHGWDDPMVPPADVVALAEELTAAGADWQIHGYGNTLHAFTNPEANAPDMGAMYKADADRRSWQAMKNFLAEVLA